MTRHNKPQKLDMTIARRLAESERQARDIVPYLIAHRALAFDVYSAGGSLLDLDTMILMSDKLGHPVPYAFYPVA